MDKEPERKDNSGMAVCKRVRYTGRVQGVGFRYTARQLAEGFAVAGFVRNLPDGSVELVAEGEKEPVEAFVAALARRMAEYIEESHELEQACSGQRGFRIRY